MARVGREASFSRLPLTERDIDVLASSTDNPASALLCEVRSSEDVICNEYSVSSHYVDRGDDVVDTSLRHAPNLLRRGDYDFDSLQSAWGVRPVGSTDSRTMSRLHGGMIEASDTPSFFRRRKQCGALSTPLRVASLISLGAVLYFARSVQTYFFVNGSQGQPDAARTNSIVGQRLVVGRSSTLAGPAAPGYTRLQVADMSVFQVGDVLEISGAKQGKVVAIERRSIVLDTPIMHPFPAGTVIAKAGSKVSAPAAGIHAQHMNVATWTTTPCITAPPGYGTWTTTPPIATWTTTPCITAPPRHPYITPMPTTAASPQVAPTTSAASPCITMLPSGHADSAPANKVCHKVTTLHSRAGVGYSRLVIQDDDTSLFHVDEVIEIGDVQQRQITSVTTQACKPGTAAVFLDKPLTHAFSQGTSVASCVLSTITTTPCLTSAPPQSGLPSAPTTKPEPNGAFITGSMMVHTNKPGAMKPSGTAVSALQNAIAKSMGVSPAEIELHPTPKPRSLRLRGPPERMLGSFSSVEVPFKIRLTPGLRERLSSSCFNLGTEFHKGLSLSPNQGTYVSDVDLLLDDAEQAFGNAKTERTKTCTGHVTKIFTGAVRMHTNSPFQWWPSGAATAAIEKAFANVLGTDPANVDIETNPGLITQPHTAQLQLANGVRRLDYAAVELPFTIHLSPDTTIRRQSFAVVCGKLGPRLTTELSKLQVPISITDISLLLDDGQFRKPACEVAVLATTTLPATYGTNAANAEPAKESASMAHKGGAQGSQWSFHGPSGSDVPPPGFGVAVGQLAVTVEAERQVAAAAAKKAEALEATAKAAASKVPPGSSDVAAMKEAAHEAAKAAAGAEAASSKATKAAKIAKVKAAQATAAAEIAPASKSTREMTEAIGATTAARAAVKAASAGKVAAAAAMSLAKKAEAQTDFKNTERHAAAAVKEGVKSASAKDPKARAKAIQEVARHVAAAEGAAKAAAAAAAIAMGEAAIAASAAKDASAKKSSNVAAMAGDAASSAKDAQTVAALAKARATKVATTEAAAIKAAAKASELENAASVAGATAAEEKAASAFMAAARGRTAKEKEEAAAAKAVAKAAAEAAVAKAAAKAEKERQASCKKKTGKPCPARGILQKVAVVCMEQAKKLTKKVMKLPKKMLMYGAGGLLLLLLLCCCCFCRGSNKNQAELDEEARRRRETEQQRKEREAREERDRRRIQGAEGQARKAAENKAKAAGDAEGSAKKVEDNRIMDTRIRKEEQAKKQAEEQAKTKAAKEAHNQKGHEKNAKASEEARIRAEAASKRRADQDAASMPHDEEEEEDDEAAGSGAGSEEPLAPKKGRLPCCGGAAKTRD